MDDFHLRLMTETDIETVLILERDAFGKMAWHKNDFASAIVSDYDYPIVICYNHQVIAYSVLRILGPEAEIENICVHPSFRQKGLGETLMDEMIRLSIERNTSRIFLEVRSQNDPARSLYEKKEFKQSYIRKNYYIDPADDAIIMARMME